VPYPMTQPTPPHDRLPAAGYLPEAEPGVHPGDLSGAKLVAGTVLLLLALVLFGSARVVSAGQRHAYDPAANPPSAYHLTAGKTYQLSAFRSVAELKKAGQLSDLSCFATTIAGVQTPVTLASTAEDDRNLHLFATLVPPSTGEYQLSCTGIPQVFVDNADNAAPDRSAPLLLLSIAAGLLGVIAACSGGYARGRSDRLSEHR